MRTSSVLPAAQLNVQTIQWHKGGNILKKMFFSDAVGK